MSKATPDKELAKLQKRIWRTFERAKAEMTAEMTDFLKKFKALDDKKRQQLEAGNLTEEAYKTWLRNQVFQSELLHAKIENVAQISSQAAQTAYKLARDAQYGVFAYGANHSYYEIEKQMGASVNLTLYSTETVKKLLKENPRLVPNKRIKSESVKTYDARKFNAYVLQGIIQGKSVYDIATAALNGMADTERRWAMNNAITALTSAENAGALQQMRNAQAMGIETLKRWNCTLDMRTRETHRLLDQETEILDEPFEVEGYEIQYPGDPNAAPEMVYHCRCHLSTVFVKYPRANLARRDNETGEVVGDVTWQEWYEKKLKTNTFDSLNLEAQPVTIESISKVKSFSCETLGIAQQRQLQNAHKRLLMTASKQPLGVEVGRVFDTNMQPLTQDIIGLSSGHSVELPDFDAPYVGIHTHPDGNVFSQKDLERFANNSSLKLLTAIGNNGTIYAVEKQASFDKKVAKILVSDLGESVAEIADQYERKEITYQEAAEALEYLVRSCLAELEGYGVKFYEQ